MAPRGRPAAAAAAAAANADHYATAYSSSPDPLAMSADSTPAPASFARTRRPASPSKSIVMNTPRVGSASPWRIKVTVQAEPESDADNTMSPTVKKVTRTRTTTVPLRDPDATSPVKRRGRPRKSDAAAAATPRAKRSGTPARNARSKSRDTSAGPAEPTTTTALPLKRGRGRPRKSVAPPTEDEETLVAPPATSPTIVPETTYTNSEQTPQENPSSRFRARRGTPHAAPIVISSDESDQSSDMLTPDSGDDQDQVLVTPQPFEDDDDDDDDDDDAQDLTNFAFEEGTTRMPDDSTIIDSEGFSMVSVHSLPSSGGLSSPPKQDETPGPAQQSIGSIMQNDYVRPSAVRELSLEHRVPPKSSPGPSRFAPAPKLVKSSPGIATHRYVTPAVDAEIPSAPPVIEQAPVLAEKKIETPSIGRVVTAGVALQGALDPNRLTPVSSSQTTAEEQRPLDNLFRGFSEGTRKQLQDGLRLGEQLAREEAEEQPTPVPERANDRRPKAAPKESVFRTQRKSRSRLLTPDEQDGQQSSTPPAAEETAVQYPTLPVTESTNALPSPERSDDDEDVNHAVGTSPTQAAVIEPQLPEATAIDSDKQSQQDDYADIWQEEASRASESSDPVAASSPHESSRQRLRPFRRRSPNQLQDSEKSSSSRQSTPSRSGSAEPQSDSRSKTNVAADIIETKEAEGDESIASDGSDDTGMFFQSNRPSRSRQKKVEKLDLSLLLGEGESLVPEDENLDPRSSPQVEVEAPAATTKPNPFLDTPPKFPAYPTSPKKSSPLRREIRGSDISSDTPRRYDDSSRYDEGSSLPVPQSSPFHTRVEGDSIVSTASDQLQFRVEMEGTTDSSIVHLRNEANGYVEAYEPQDRTLDEINEVTEHSRTWNQDSSILPSSPPRIQQSFMEGSSVLARNQLLDEASSSGPRAAHGQSDSVDGSELEGSEMSEETEAASSPTTRSPTPQVVAPRQPSARTSRRSLVSGLIRSAPSSPQVPSHPILAKITPLPKVEPWTKTHYKTLDKLHSAHLKHPHLFSPAAIPATPLSRTNASLLEEFMAATGKPYVGAVFSAWGYSFAMTPELVVLCAVFMKNLTLNTVNEYEELSGSPIQMGDCGPGRTGDLLKPTNVMDRLATVVLGERVREDEKKGRRIDRSQSLTIMWP